ncbi:Transcription initiation factor TFIID subunit 9 [Cucumispora dikerogammari]|nr:Transcription initiation factor TFIID subunit 9 [Cucumispora dikerogammari]
MKVKLKNIPQEAQIISLILKTQGISECDPAIIPQLIEYSNQFISNIFKKAKRYQSLIRTEDNDAALTSNLINLSIEDIKHSYVKIPPNRQYVSEISSFLNAKPLKLLNDEKVTYAVVGKGNVLGPDFKIKKK